MSFICRILICVSLFIGCHLYANSDTFEMGNEAFHKGDYKRAIDSYLKTMEEEDASVSVLINLSNAYFQQKDYANSRLYIEKAALIKPFHPAIKQNRKIIRNKINSDIIPVPLFFLTASLFWVSSLFSPLVWFILGIISSITVLYIVYARKSKTGLVSALFLVFLFATLGWHRSHALSNQHVVVINKETAFRNSPSEVAEELMLLKAGEKGTEIERFGDYSRIRLEDGKIGYVDIENVSFAHL